METTGHSRRSADKSAFQMIDVGHKATTYRRAIARGKILLSLDAFQAIRQGTNPKGNVLALAEIAGIQAAKRTSEAIPLCHPLPLEQVQLRFEEVPSETSIRVFCEVSASAKTGVEMEALSGVNGALLTIYDLSKAVNPVLTLSEIRLDYKEGGKNGIWVHPDRESDMGSEPSRSAALEGVRAAVLTVSDRCTREESMDRSGPELVKALESVGACVAKTHGVPDEVERIREAILDLSADGRIPLVLVTGGTGIAPRDVTPEALAPLWTKKIPGIGELLRARGASQTPMSWLSRSEGGLVGKSLVILLPGSPRAVLQGWDAIREILPHALEIVRGAGH